MCVKYKSEPDILVDLRNRFPAIRDQGPRPLCLAFAASDHNTFVNNTEEALSVEYLSYHSYLRAGVTDYTQGLTIQSVIYSLENHGQPHEILAPYNESVAKPTIPSTTFKELFYAEGEEKNDLVNELIKSLDKGHATTIGVKLNTDFYNPLVPFVIDDKLGNSGKHALVVVGYGRYTDGEPCFLIRNSWGKSWADNGYAWLTQNFIKNRIISSLRLSIIS